MMKHLWWMIVIGGPGLGGVIIGGHTGVGGGQEVAMVDTDIMGAVGDLDADGAVILDHGEAGVVERMGVALEAAAAVALEAAGAEDLVVVAAVDSAVAGVAVAVEVVEEVAAVEVVEVADKKLYIH